MAVPNKPSKRYGRSSGNFLTPIKFVTSDLSDRGCVQRTSRRGFALQRALVQRDTTRRSNSLRLVFDTAALRRRSAAALDLSAGEQVQWQLLARSDLRLLRLEAPAHRAEC
jgi:hypothetical protein